MEAVLRKVIRYSEVSGTMTLECGHIEGKRPGSGFPKRTKCSLCARWNSTPYEETVLAMAQATIQNAMNDANLSQAQIAGKMGCSKQFVAKILGGDDLTIKFFARALAACGKDVKFATSSQ